MAQHRTQPRWPLITLYNFHGACHFGFAIEGAFLIGTATVVLAVLLPNVDAVVATVLLGVEWYGTTAEGAFLPKDSSKNYKLLIYYFVAHFNYY